MHTIAPTLISEALDLIRRNPTSISVALLQRHLVLGYSMALELMSRLIELGHVIDCGEANDSGRYVAGIR
jgi:DNA-binding IclR family transcriptional regulator